MGKTTEGFDFVLGWDHEKKPLSRLFFMRDRRMLFACAFIDGLHQFGRSLAGSGLQGRMVVQGLGFGPAAAVVGDGGLLGQLLDLGEHDAHGVPGYDDMSAFPALGGRDILEAEQVVSALHLIGDGFLGDSVASAFLADHGNLV
jgi:hypothetical protein